MSLPWIILNFLLLWKRILGIENRERALKGKIYSSNYRVPPHHPHFARPIGITQTRQSGHSPPVTRAAKRQFLRQHHYWKELPGHQFRKPGFWFSLRFWLNSVFLRSKTLLIFNFPHYSKFILVGANHTSLNDHIC